MADPAVEVSTAQFLNEEEARVYKRNSRFATLIFLSQVVMIYLGIGRTEPAEPLRYLLYAGVGISWAVSLALYRCPRCKGRAVGSKFCPKCRVTLSARS